MTRKTTDPTIYKMDLSAVLLLSSPVGVLAALVLCLFAFTVVEASQARKKSEGKHNVRVVLTEEEPDETVGSVIEEELSKIYEIAEDYRADIIKNMSLTDSTSSLSDVSLPSRRGSTVDTLVQAVVSPCSLSREELTHAIGELNDAAEEADEIGEERRTSWPTPNALRRRKRGRRMGSLHIIPERK